MKVIPIQRNPDVARKELFEKLDGDLLDALVKQVDAISKQLLVPVNAELTELLEKRNKIKEGIPKDV